ncbi:MAG: hypothetical protein DMG49_23450 [Acidobacteria bacterium]|nr:MAG: hypothetical protein DMG49_23450 [Acidobacteriota bacterium]
MEADMDWYLWVGFLQLGIALVGGFFGFLVVTSAPLWPFTGNRTVSTKQKIIGFVTGTIGTAGTIVLADGMIAALPYASRAFLTLMQLLGLQLVQLLIGAGVVVLGYLAYRFKRAKQTAYGAVEIMFAAAVAIVIAKQMSRIADWTGPAASLGAAVYVVSRGLGNYAEGVAKRTA